MSSVVLSGDSSGTVTLTVPAVAGTNTVTVPASTGNVVIDSATQTLTNKTIQGGTISAATTVATTSGTAFDFTGIPSWVKRITILMNEVSTNGGSNIEVQLGTASGIVTSGYLTTTSIINGTSVTNGSATNGLFTSWNPGASNSFSGLLTICTLGSNIWVSSGVARAATNSSSMNAGVISLGGTLTQVRFTSDGGTNTFDNGSVTIYYEG